MSLNIWMQCGGKSNLTALSNRACRIVENQYISSTRHLVDSLDEHHALEKAIEIAKPLMRFSSNFPYLHFLLATPFRYPPLKYGSRFGTLQEAGIWYGSLSVRTALAEAAYYRLRSLYDSTAEIASQTEHTIYWVSVRSKNGVDLTAKPFHKYGPTITDKSSYAATQPLGAAMRKDNVGFFRYASARDPQPGINIGVFTPAVFQDKQLQEPRSENWHIFATKQTVECKLKEFNRTESLVFQFSYFAVDGKLPVPGV